jgi:hypothetical protein
MYVNINFRLHSGRDMLLKLGILAQPVGEPVDAQAWQIAPKRMLRTSDDLIRETAHRFNRRRRVYRP